MSNFLYAKALEAFAQAQINLLADNIKAVLVDEGAYTPLPTSDQYLADIAVGARVATSGNLASKSVTGGAFSAANVSFTSISGNSIESIVIYQDTGVAATSRLIAHLDTGYTNLPVLPNGGNIDLVWPSGTNKIFSL